MASDRQRQSSKQNRRKSQAAFASFPASAPLSVPKPSANSVAYPEANGRFPAESLPTSSGKGPLGGLDRLGRISDLLDSATAEPPLVSWERSAQGTLSNSTNAYDASARVEPAKAAPIGESPDWRRAIDSKIQELVEHSRAFEREKSEIEQLREHLRQSIDVAEARLAATASNESIQRLGELESLLAEANTENAKLSNLLHHARSEYQSLVEFIELDANADPGLEEQTSESPGLHDELVLEITQLRDQIQFLQNELSESQAEPAAAYAETAELRIQVEKLRSQLLEARNEAVESRLQSNDLSSSLAKFKDPFEGQRSEALTWEQRKEALMRQLDAETQSDEPCDPEKVLEIQSIIQKTDAEIQRRDQEIQDLRYLLEQQAIAQNGMAIGVAAVAEMIESDAMIIAERLRLQEMQQEWEKKQRQAEIEMSLERAKLARERLELQEKSRTFEADHPPESAEEKSATKERGRGRWLARLGLRDE
jgi:hypothetical protein